MIKFQDIAIRRGTQLLFDQANFDLYDGENVGLVGDNGSGKTSLLLMLLGQINSDLGDLFLPKGIRISHVAQETPSDERSVVDHVLDGDAEYRRVESTLNSMDGAHDEESAKLFTKMQDIDGYSAPARAAKLLSGLGFKASEQSNPTRSFSGGWRVRMNLAQALMSPSDLLLLDEPTNHLDLDAIVWLEEWLKKYTGTLILISHDRDFLDGCCRRILHIDNGRLRSYTGNYSQFELTRAERLANEKNMYERQQKKVAHMESFIQRFKYKASKAKQAQSRIKALEKMQLIAPAYAGSPFNFEFKSCGRVSDPILKLDHVDAGYGDKVVLSDVSLSIVRGDRIGLLGVNGAGKSTLIKILAEDLTPMSGTRLANKHLQIGYFAQHQLEQLDPLITPMQQFQQLYPKTTSQEVRRFLGGFDFQGERVSELIGPFSGGEKARLALALLIYEQPNILLLDEPTNHLDMEMRHALSMAMQSYEGAIILVSHDRSLINSVTDKLLLIRFGKVEAFDEDMGAYLTLMRQENSDKSDEKGSISEEKTSQNKKQRRQVMAQRRQQLRPIRDQIHQLENDMTKLKDKIDELDIALGNPDTYEAESTSNLAAMMQKKSELESRLKQAESKWVTSAEQLETLEASIN